MIARTVEHNRTAWAAKNMRIWFRMAHISRLWIWTNISFSTPNRIFAFRSRRADVGPPPELPLLHIAAAAAADARPLEESRGLRRRRGRCGSAALGLVVAPLRLLRGAEEEVVLVLVLDLVVIQLTAVAGGEVEVAPHGGVGGPGGGGSGSAAGRDALRVGGGGGAAAHRSLAPATGDASHVAALSPAAPPPISSCKHTHIHLSLFTTFLNNSHEKVRSSISL